MRLASEGETEVSMTRILTVILALLALAVVPSAASAAQPQQWTFNNYNGPLTAATDYELVNLTGGRIGYKDRTGVDLAWTTSGGNFRFMRGNPNDHRRITGTEPLAIYNTKTKKYLVYGSQTFGINLDWSSTPTFEWKVDQAGQRFSLYNLRSHDYVVYGSRTFGINLVWAGLTNQGEGQRTASIPLDKEGLIWTGYQGFRGKSGVDGKNDTLLKVQNASADTMYFLTARTEDSWTGNPADIKLDPGQTMTASQMQAAFKSTTPKLHDFMEAFIKLPTSVTRTYLNITYVDRP
jgi:hypothetical protein